MLRSQSGREFSNKSMQCTETVRVMAASTVWLTSLLYKAYLKYVEEEEHIFDEISALRDSENTSQPGQRADWK